MVVVFLILALLFGGIALWGAMGMLHVARKRYEFDAGDDDNAADGRAAG